MPTMPSSNTIPDFLSSAYSICLRSEYDDMYQLTALHAIALDKKQFWLVGNIDSYYLADTSDKTGFLVVITMILQTLSIMGESYKEFA